MSNYKNPYPTVDVIITMGESIVWIYRKNAPEGWALPGGFVDRGESVEQAAIREAHEETGLEVTLKDLLYVYSSPHRDPRQHNLSVVFTATAEGMPEGRDDAVRAELFPLRRPPSPIVFDHEEILNDYIRFTQTGQRPTPASYLQKHEASLQ